MTLWESVKFWMGRQLVEIGMGIVMFVILAVILAIIEHKYGTRNGR